MATDTLAPLSAIVGIGPAAEAALQGLGAFTVADLLRATPQRLHGAVASFASLEEVRSWCQMASLLHVAGLTPKRAAVLVQHGLRTIEDLGHADFDRLAELLRSDEAGAPGPAQVAALIRDATVLSCTDALTATVRDAQGEPAEGARVRVAQLEQTTDRRGRCRIVRIPRGRTPTVTIEHAGHRTWSAPVRRLHGPEVIDVRLFHLERATSATPAEPQRLSELAGDVLPPPHGAPLRMEATEQLRENDLLLLHAKEGDEARLASRFLSYEQGRFIVTSIRLLWSSLPAGAKVGDHFRVQQGQLRAARVTPLSLRAAKRFRQMARAFAGRPRPVTPMEVEQDLQARFDWLRQHGVVRRSRSEGEAHGG